MPPNVPRLPPFEAPYAADDGAIATALLATVALSAEQDARIDRTATRLIGAIRTRDDRLGGVEDMLREFALSTKEGLALMVLAEALLRVPDARTADQFIEDKLGQGDFIHHETRSSAFLVNASAWALGMSARVIQPGETPHGTIGRLAKRLGVPAVRAATRQAMRLMGSHFVLGETIEAALERARSADATRYSFDMLGEGARTAADAERYFNSYASAIEAIGRAADDRALPDRPGISVKLSALHPRFEAVSRQRVMNELVPRLIDLARRAMAFDLNFTVDAEEADRLELALEVIAAAFRDTSFKGWDGFGLAIQAYQKRAQAVIGHSDDLARALNRRMMLRLVKGAYWDTEIKRAQERGLDDYPVFSRKAMTDLNYIACAQQLLGLRRRIFPQFATHNALTVATVLELAHGTGGFEFQRLHGMGEALYAQLGEDRPDLACRTYAPVGSHRDLLAYLVRRLLENGANSSFVAVAADDSVPVATLLRRPADIVGTAANARHPNIRLPRDLYQPQRRNSRGIEFGERAALNELVASIAAEDNAGGGKHRRRDAGRRECGDISGARGIQGLEPDAGASARGSSRTGGDPAGAKACAFHRAAATRGRQDPRRCAFRSPRGRRFLPLLRRRRPPVVRRRRAAARADRREQRSAAARSRRLRRDIAMEFSAGDLSGAGCGGADGRQCGGGKARRTDPADRGGGRAFAAPGGRARIGAESGARRRRHRRGAWSRIPTSPVSSSPAPPKSRDRSTGRWPPRTARSCR